MGPQVGDELREQGGLAMLLALGLVMLYIAFRFQFKFAVGAVVALVHDVLITLGFFSVTGMEFDLTVLAALLAVIGYSLNDTVVIFDRIRENFRKIRKGTVLDIVNAIRRLMQSPLEAEVRNVARGEIRDQYLSAAKARETLRWRVTYDLERLMQGATLLKSSEFGRAISRLKHRIV